MATPNRLIRPVNGLGPDRKPRVRGSLLFGAACLSAVLASAACASSPTPSATVPPSTTATAGSTAAVRPSATTTTTFGTAASAASTVTTVAATPSTTTTTLPSTTTTTAAPIGNPFPPQPNVILRVVFVTEDWMPFHETAWSSEVPRKESEVLRFYEAAIWEETESVHLYAFPDDFHPWLEYTADIPEDQLIADREQHAISVHGGLPPKQDAGRRSEFLRRVFEDFAAELVELHPDAEHHLLYHGHGAPGGYLFERQLRIDDADAFLASWTARLGRPLGVIDMGGPCNKGGYDDLANFCRHARYYVASDLPNGGYQLDEWTYEKHRETEPEAQYHRIFASADTLEGALVERVDIRRKRYEYARENLTRQQWAQANYLYSCPKFGDFREAFERFLARTSVQSGSYDLYQLLLDNSAPSELLESFHSVIVHAADNRDFFEWEVAANGMVSPDSLR